MLRNIKYLFIDVDGTLTDGGIYYDSTGNEIKKFNVKDGTGIVLAHAADMKVIVLTGRECIATKRRLEELQVDFFFQNIKDKRRFLKKFLEDNKIKAEKTGYIGDDLNDLDPMKLVNFTACPADACSDVKAYVDYVSSVNGGCGAVREIIEYILKQNTEWDESIKMINGRIDDNGK